ncbi:MAG: hypothetical protein ACREO5_03135 [Candidatus Binatia bacterium]
MKNRHVRSFVLSLIVALFLSMLAASASAQRPTRITFARGATTKIVTGTLSGYRSHKTYVIHVRRGQTLTTEAVKNFITIGVEAPPGSTYEQDMAADCHDKNEVSPTARGDYKITVTECRKADRWRGTFRFRVTVR